MRQDALVPHVPRPPSFDHGVVSFLWALLFGLILYFGMKAVSISAATSFIVAAVAAVGIFFFVRVFGGDAPPKREARVSRAQPPDGHD